MTKQALIVDDSQTMREMVIICLETLGLDVDEASGGRSGLEKAKSKQFDIIVTDQNMPGMDGLDLVRSLRLLPAYAKTPILVLTTETSDEMKAAFRAAGATGWMSKPFSPERMTAAITKML
jgi:two-component system chemotaxis response regulator CheY